MPTGVRATRGAYLRPFLFDDGRMMTPPLTRTLLDRVTRRGIAVREEAHAIDR